MGRQTSIFLTAGQEKNALYRMNNRHCVLSHVQECDAYIVFEHCGFFANRYNCCTSCCYQLARPVSVVALMQKSRIRCEEEGQEEQLEKMEKNEQETGKGSTEQYNYSGHEWDPNSCLNRMILRYHLLISPVTQKQ